MGDSGIGAALARDSSPRTTIRVGNDPAIVTNQMVLAFYRHWLALSGARRMPSRAEIDPMNFPKHLPGVLLLRVQPEPLDLQYRIIGEDVIARLGNMTGKWVRQSALANFSSSAYENYCSVVESGLPQFLEGESVTAFRKDRSYRISRIHCPLSSDGTAIDWIISYVSFL